MVTMSLHHNLSFPWKVEQTHRMINWLTWHPGQCFCSAFATQVSDTRPDKWTRKQWGSHLFRLCAWKVQSQLYHPIWCCYEMVIMFEGIFFLFSRDPPLFHVKKKCNRTINEVHKQQNLVEWVDRWAQASTPKPRYRLLPPGLLLVSLLLLWIH